MKDNDWLILILVALAVYWIFMRDRKPPEATNAESWEVVRDDQGRIQGFNVSRHVTYGKAA